jgi:hypothetical protein
MTLLAVEEMSSISTEAVWVGGIAVVLAAVITLVGVYLQTAKTLQAERERLDDQLNAEKERLGIQLAHDRATRERAELRAILDSAAASMDELAFAAIQALSAAERLVRAIGSDASTGDDDSRGTDSANTAAEEKLDDLFALIRRVDGHSSQMGMRLGVDHPVCVAYKDSRSHFGELHTRLIELDVADGEEATRLMAQAGEKAREFESSASAVIRTEIG